MTADASWLDAMPECYDRCLGPALFAPHARHLAEVAAGFAPRAVLEIAAGTGIVTDELLRALPAARITATDLNAAMVAWAAQRVSGADWQPADAQALPFPDDGFDLAVCQFGMMFFPDKAKAVAEIKRVLRTEGRFAFSVWDAVEASPFPAALVAALAEIFPDDPPDFVVRVPHGYHDPDRIHADVTAGGLVVDSIERVVLRGTSVSAAALAEGFCLGTPLRFELEQRGDPARLTQDVAERMTARLGAGPVIGDLAAFLVVARTASGRS